MKARGLSHMAPTYFVGSRDQSLPSVVVVATLFHLDVSLVPDMLYERHEAWEELR